MDLWAGKECWNTCSSLGHLREKTFVSSAFPTWTHRAPQHALCVRADVQFKSSDWCRFCCLLFTSAVRVKVLVQAAQEAWERLMSLMSSWSSQTMSDLVVCLRSLVHNSVISFHGFTASEDLSAYQCLPPAWNPRRCETLNRSARNMQHKSCTCYCWVSTNFHYWFHSEEAFVLTDSYNLKIILITVLL